MQARLLQTGHLDGSTNMAIDEMLLVNSRHLLETRYQAILRLYGWVKPTLSLGYFQSPSFDIDWLKGNKGEKDFSFEIVRRLTGGGTVLHDVEITYSFIILEDNCLIPEKITESYRVICQGIIKGLDKLGIKAGFFDIKDNPGSGYYSSRADFCFAKHSKYDVLVDRKKLVGSAQRRKKGIILQHGSIILGIDQQKNLYLLKKGINCFQEAVSLKEILGYSISFEEVSQVLIEGFKLALGISFESGELTSQELKLAESLKTEKYTQDSWSNRLGKKYEKNISERKER